MMDGSAHPEATGGGLDFSVLESSDAYARYFNQLGKMFELLLHCFRRRSEEGIEEALVLVPFLDRMLNTVQCLRVKYTYNREQHRPLWVDLTESGFPNAHELEGLFIDLQQREAKLRELAPLSVLKGNALDYIFEHLSEPFTILSDLSQRTYLEMLDQRMVFFPFVRGALTLRLIDSAVRSYSYTWACYDYVTNRPYIHLLELNQDISEQPLEQSGESFERFIEVIQAEGSRAPDVALLAMAIDDALETIHPKILKRFCIGPLYSPLLLNDRTPNVSDQREMALRELFKQYIRSDHDFVLYFTHEVVFSKREERSKSFLAAKEKVRQVYAIADTGGEAQARRASLVHHNVLLPHYLLQHLDVATQRVIPGFEAAKKYSFDDRGEIHGI